jgi:hypothetical protein
LDVVAVALIINQSRIEDRKPISNLKVTRAYARLSWKHLSTFASVGFEQPFSVQLRHQKDHGDRVTVHEAGEQNRHFSGVSTMDPDVRSRCGTVVRNFIEKRHPPEIVTSKSDETLKLRAVA